MNEELQSSHGKFERASDDELKALMVEINGVMKKHAITNGWKGYAELMSYETMASKLLTDFLVCLYVSQRDKNNVDKVMVSFFEKMKSVMDQHYDIADRKMQEFNH